MHLGITCSYQRLNFAKNIGKIDWAEAKTIHGFSSSQSRSHVQKWRQSIQEYRSVSLNVSFWHLIGNTTILRIFKNFFPVIHKLVDNEEAVYMVELINFPFLIWSLISICTIKATYDVIREFANDNVKYLELRTTPKTNPTENMTPETYVKSVIKGWRIIDYCNYILIMRFFNLSYQRL